MPTLADLGQLVQKKYPGSYDGLDPSEIGRRVQQKHPGAYDDFQDQPPQQQAAPSSQQPAAPDTPQMAQQPAPPAPPVSVPGPGAGNLAASGFGGTQMAAQLAPPPGSPPIVGQGYFNENEQRRRYNKQFDIEAEHAARGRELQQTKQAEITATRAEIDHNIQILKDGGIWSKLSPRQQADVRIGSKNITPELRPQNQPGYVSGKTILASDPGALSALGQPISKDDFHRVRVLSDGTREYMPVAGGITTKTYIDVKDGKGYIVSYDRDHNELGREEIIDPRTLPQVTINSTSGTSMVTVPLENPDTHVMETVQVPTPHNTSTSTTTQRVLPGGATAPASPAAPSRSLLPPPRSGGAISNPPATPPAADAPGARKDLPPGSRVLGRTASQQKKDVENPWTPQAIAVMNQIEPRIKSLERMETALKAMPKGSRLTLERAAYALGFGGDTSKLLTELNMSGITSAAALLKNTSRASSVLNQATIHTPRDWKDEVGLMLDKIGVMKNNLNDVLGTAKKYGLKNPGLTPPPSGERKPLDEIFK